MNIIEKISVVFAVSALFSSAAAFAQASADASATGSVRIISPITLAKTSDLAFGSVVRPSSGTNIVTVTPAGARSLTGSGDGVIATGTAFSSAGYTVGGEGGQSFTITVPATFDMASGSDLITVTLTASAASDALSGSIGTSGSADFNVGGSFTVADSTPLGAYSGSFTATVAYN